MESTSAPLATFDPTSLDTAKKLAASMLNPNPAQRPSFAEVLDHPLLKNTGVGSQDIRNLMVDLLEGKIPLSAQQPAQSVAPLTTTGTAPSAYAIMNADMSGATPVVPPETGNVYGMTPRVQTGTPTQNVAPATTPSPPPSDYTIMKADMSGPTQVAPQQTGSVYAFSPSVQAGTRTNGWGLADLAVDRERDDSLPNLTTLCEQTLSPPPPPDEFDPNRHIKA